MTLELNSLSVDCVIGELPEERKMLQRLVVDASLEIPDDAAQSDELCDTVDYAALAERIREALVEAECRMIERAAKIAAEVCMAEKKVLSAKVRVTKSGAVRHLASASVVLALAKAEAGT